MFYAEYTHDDDNIVANFGEYFDAVWHDDMLSKDAAVFYKVRIV